MASKVQAAKIAVRAGIPLVIASGRKTRVLADILNGAEEGTIFVAQPQKLPGRKRWIAFFHHPKGTLFVDDGAKQALREGGKSLLPPGVRECEGAFVEGDVVRICDLDGTEFARGIAKFSGAEIKSGQLPRAEVVHRDDLVIL
jgi:glutamate 5-kinase